MSVARSAAVESASPRLAGRAHIPALDGFRGIAVLSVMIFHLLPEAPRASAAFRVIFALTRYGFFGVGMFFVLSGFLITGILLDTREEQGRFKKFYSRRALRIFPLYFGVLIVLFGILAPLGWFNTPGLQRVLHHQYWLWIYSANIPICLTDTWYFNVGWLNASHLWSLAVEEHFYLCWPLLVFICCRKTILRVCLALVIVAFISRTAFQLHGNYLGTWTFTFSQCDGLAIGAAAAIVARSENLQSFTPKRLNLVALVCLGLLLVLVFVRTTQIYGVTITQNLRYLFMNVFSAVTILSATLFPSGYVARLLNRTFLKLLGKYSYGLYVYHVLLLWFLGKYIGDDFVYRYIHSPALASLAVFVLSGAAVFAVAFLSWHLYEKQFLKLKKYFDYRVPAATEKAIVNV
jgi:peptidoglycan/LPS O-acetylase OafA/YrhL